eukprot:TRINITY_DN592_c0_g2_i13.p1 TRINITY_DN592_c0_g2~~TRINITY_DN592_c0_g2_i13.p1  ORF type:complete len:2420 (+),score=598.21 TRINITY_DN592_c0_g2_i13:132-7391(+)
MSYLKHFTTGGPPERGWDSRFTLGQIPDYNALNDRYCKFWKKRSKVARNAAASWGVGQTGMGGLGASPGVPLEGPMLAFQQPAPPDTMQMPLQMPTADMVPQHERLSMTDPGGYQRHDMAPSHPVQLLTAQDLRRPHRVTRTPKAQSQPLPAAQPAPPPQQASPPQPSPAASQASPLIRDQNPTEVLSMLDVRNITVQIEKTIEIREGFLYLLQELTERAQTQQLDKDQLVKEINHIIHSLRTATLDCVEFISKWENLQGPTYQPYLWKGVSYLSKLQTDLTFFGYSKIANYLDFSVVGNPLLIRNEESRHGNGAGLPPVKQGKEHSGISKSDPLGERLTMAQQYLKRVAGVAGDEIEEEGYLYGLEEDEAEGEDEKEVPEDDWLARTEDRSKEVEGQAAVHVQRVYRGFRDRNCAKQKSRQRRAAVVLQKLGRKINAKHETSLLRAKRSAAQRIQSYQRGITSREKVKHIRLERFCATEIQRNYRGYLGRRISTAKAYERGAVVKIQAVFRGFSTRKRLETSRKTTCHTAAVMIQKHWRGRLVRSDVRFDKSKLGAVEKLQSWNRGIIARNVSGRMKSERSSAMKIQAWLRGCMARQRAAEIRAERRATSNEDALILADKAATTVQAGWRMHSTRQRVKRDVQEKREEQAATSIQAHFRGHDVRKHKKKDSYVQEHNEAATKIQTQYRMRKARKDLAERKKLHSSAVNIQRIERGRQARTVVKSKQSEYNEELSKRKAQMTGLVLEYEVPNVTTVVEAQDILEKSASENLELKMQLVQEAMPTSFATSIYVSDKDDQKGTSDSTLDDREHVNLLLEVASSTGFDGDGLMLLREAGSNLPVSIMTHMQVVSPKVPPDVQKISPKSDSPKSTSPRSKLKMSPKANVAPIQRGWRCHQARKDVDKKRELKRHNAVRMLHTAKQQEKERAQVIIHRFSKGIEAKRKAKERAYTVYLQSLKNADIAAKQERTYAVHMLQKWMGKMVDSRRATTQRRDRRHLERVKQGEQARRQEREWAVLMIQSQVRVRGAKKNISELLRLRNLERMMIEAEAREQETEFIAKLEREEQQAEEHRITFAQAEEDTRMLMLHDAEAEMTGIYDQLKDAIREQEKLKRAEEQLAEQRIQEKRQEEAEEAAKTAKKTEEEQTAPKVVTETPAVEQTDDAGAHGLKYLMDVADKALLQSTSPSTVHSNTSSLSALNCLLLASEQSLFPLHCLTTLGNLMAGSGSEASSPEFMPHFVSPFPGVGLEALLVATPEPLQHIQFLVQCIDNPAESAFFRNDTEAPQVKQEPEKSAQSAQESVPEDGKTELKPEPESMQPEPDAEPPAPSQADEAIAAAVKKVETASNEKMLMMEERLAMMQERLEQMERSETKRLEDETARMRTQQKQQEDERKQREEQEHLAEIQREEEAARKQSALQQKEGDRQKQEEEDKKAFEASMAKMKEADNKHKKEGEQLAMSRVESSQKFKDDKILAEKKARHEAAITIQCKYRQVVAVETCKAARNEKQRIFQEAEERERQERESSAAQIIQRNWGGKVTRMQNTRVFAVMTIQALFRGAQGRVLAKQRKTEIHEEQYEKAQADMLHDNSATTIQKNWRGTKGREQAARAKQHRCETVEDPAARTIQRSVRVKQAKTETQRRKELQDMKNTEAEQNKLQEEAACTIQRAWRCYNARFEASWRRNKKREALQKSKSETSAIVIQKQLRCHLARQEVKAKKKQKEEIQKQKVKQDEEHEQQEAKLADKQKAAQVEEEEAARRTNAAVIIQRAYKCYNSKFMLKWKRSERNARRTKEMLADEQGLQDSAATTVQCMYRCRMAREERRKRLESKELQKRMKSEEETRIETAATTIQCAYRCFNARFEAAWRREKKQKLQQSETTRKKKEVKEHEILTARQAATQARREKEEAAAIVIQCAWRCYNARFQRKWMGENKTRNEELRKKKAEEDKSTRVIQRATRCHLARKEKSRRFEAKQEIEALSLKRAKEERDLEINKAATTMQCMVRSGKARRTAKTKREERDAKISSIVYNERRHRAARTIQCLYRCRIAKFELEYRKLVEHEEVELERTAEMDKAALKIQTKYRAHAAQDRVNAKREENHLQEQNNAATKIQSQWKGKQDRKEVQEMKENRKIKQLDERQREDAAKQAVEKEEQEAATKLQAQYRGHAAREDLKKKKLERLEKERDELKKEEERIERDNAAAKIQTRWRGHDARTKYEEKFEKRQTETLEKESKAATTIQAAARGRAARKASKTAAKEKELKDEISQEEETVAHGKDQAATKIQTQWRCREARKEKQGKEDAKLQQHKSATKIQSQWRARQARKRVKDLKASRGNEALEDLTEDETFCREEITEDALGEAEVIYKSLLAEVRSVVTDEETRAKAATRIQAQFRGFKARNATLELMYLQQQHEAMEEAEERTQF